MKLFSKIAILISTLSLFAFANAEPKVVAYYPYWAQYSQFYPKDVRWDFLTTIHYVGFVANEQGALAIVDESDLANFEELAKLARTKNIALLVSIGGVDNASTLSTVAANPATLSELTKNAIQLVKQYGLSGIELDWIPQDTDKGAYASLVKGLAAGFAQESPKPSLSVTLSPNEATVSAYDIDALSSVDYFVVQTFDLMDAEKTAVVANASTPKAQQALEFWAARGIDASKLIPVVPFYGKSFSGATGLGSSHNGVGTGNEGVLSYKELMEKFDGPNYKVTFDEASQSEIAVSKEETIVFNGIPSVRSMASMVKKQNYGGIAAFDISNDYPNSRVSLLVTIGLELRPTVNYKAKKR